MDVTAVALPKAAFDQLLAESDGFRNFVFTTYSERFTDVFLTIEEVAFKKIDVRLAQKLVELGGDADSVNVTHQQLAVELGTAREVISRQLKEFQRRGWITQARGSIVITEKASLTGLADS